MIGLGCLSWQCTVGNKSKKTLISDCELRALRLPGLWGKRGHLFEEQLLHKRRWASSQHVAEQGGDAFQSPGVEASPLRAGTQTLPEGWGDAAQRRATGTKGETTHHF